MGFFCMVPIPNLYEGYFKTPCRKPLRKEWVAELERCAASVCNVKGHSGRKAFARATWHRSESASEEPPQPQGHLCSDPSRRNKALLISSLVQKVRSESLEALDWDPQLLTLSRIHWNSLFEDFKWTCAHMSPPSWPLSKQILIRAKWRRINPFCYSFHISFSTRIRAGGKCFSKNEWHQPVCFAMTKRVFMRIYPCSSLMLVHPLGQKS